MTSRGEDGEQGMDKREMLQKQNSQVSEMMKGIKKMHEE